MLELGWTRRELRIADPDDVVGIRWGLFARSLASVIESLNVEELERAMTDEIRPPSKAARQYRMKSNLAKARELRASMRRALLLDDEEEGDSVSEET